MRIVTKILTILAISTLLTTVSISLLIIQNPLSNNTLNIDNEESFFDTESDDNQDKNQDDEDITDLRFYGTWEITEEKQFLNITSIDSSYKDYDTRNPSVGEKTCSSSPDIYIENKELSFNDTSQNETDQQQNEYPSSDKNDSSSADDEMTFIQGNYDIDTKNQTITRIDQDSKIIFSYNFSNNNNTLTLTNLDTKISYVYQRYIYNVNSSEELKKHSYQKVNVTGKISLDNNSYWSNLTLSDNSNVSFNTSNIDYNFSNIDGKIVSFNANMIPFDTNISDKFPYSYENNCSCYLSNIEPYSIHMAKE